MLLWLQRVVDVILKAFGAAAGSQGCMNNFTFGNARMGYYETIAGGACASLVFACPQRSWVGSRCVHYRCEVCAPLVLCRRRCRAHVAWAQWCAHTHDQHVSGGAPSCVEGRGQGAGGE
jgi:hypothetical protein